MSTIKSSAENLTLNADGANNDIKFQSNGTEVASIDQAGVMTATSFAGSGAALTGVGVDGIVSNADATAITIDSSERVGVGTTSPLTNSLLHIQASASSGVSAINNGLLLVENSTGVGVGLLSNNDRQQTIAFGDPQDNDVGFINYGHDTNQMSFNVNASERLRITDNGITFNGDTAAANALDDYEEGTWTPVLTDLTNNATMHALTAGVYTKIGRLVTVTANVRTSSLGSVSGNLYVTGFPYTSANTDGNHGAGAVANAENMNITAGHAITLYVGKNGAKGRFDIYDTSQGITGLQSGEWSSDGMAAITATYSI